MHLQTQPDVSPISTRYTQMGKKNATLHPETCTKD